MYISVLYHTRLTFGQRCISDKNYILQKKIEMQNNSILLLSKMELCLHCLLISPSESINNHITYSQFLNCYYISWNVFEIYYNPCQENYISNLNTNLCWQWVCIKIIALKGLTWRNTETFCYERIL